jgi:non-homologous end joining protein Ku
MSERERVIMLRPWEKDIMGTTVRYPYEVRDSKDYFYDISDVKVQPDLLQLAEHISEEQGSALRPFAIRRSLRADRSRSPEEQAGRHAGKKAGRHGPSTQRCQPLRRPTRQHCA